MEYQIGMEMVLQQRADRQRRIAGQSSPSTIEKDIV
jgi:hypothetical protein